MRKSMSTLFVSLLAALLLALWPGSSTAGDILLYGSTGGANSNGGGRLYTINPDTQAVDLIGDTGFDRLGGIGFDALGTLYGVAGGSAGPATFMTINPDTGQADVIGGLLDIQGVDALAFAADGTLFGGGWNLGTGRLDCRSARPPAMRVAGYESPLAVAIRQ